MEFQVPRADMRRAEVVMKIIPQVMAQRGLPPLFSGWMITRYMNLSWLFGVVDVHQVEKLERYTDKNLVHQMSTALDNLPVYLSNSSGLRYVTLLSPRPRMQRTAVFPGLKPGMVQMGVRFDGSPVAVDWDRLGHALVAGMTGSGKSTFLRLLAYQAEAEGFKLGILDPEMITFPMFQGRESLIAPIATDALGAVEMLNVVLGECDHRAMLYKQVEGFPEKLTEYNELARKAGKPTLPRIIVIMDEFNATVMGSKALAEKALMMGWKVRKYGVNLIFAAQDFSKDILGNVRDQLGALIAFKVKAAEIARNVGVEAAAKIPEDRPGLAVSDRWGPMQTYYLDKNVLLNGPVTPVEAIPTEWKALAMRAMSEQDGRMSIPVLVGWGMSEREARGLIDEWEMRGWLKKDPKRDNARYITGKMADLLSNRQTGQTASNPSNRSQTASDKAY
jgi:hypothetical protein